MRKVKLWRKLGLAAKALIASRSSTYKARNGREVGIEDESGEKMWIVPFNEMDELEAAIEDGYDGE